MSPHNPTRRDFIADTTKVALGAMILPRHVLGGRGFQAPSATLNIAIVGAGGMGMSNLTELLSENIVAICDVDFPYVERSLEGRLRPRQGPQVDAAREAERMTESRKLQDIYTRRQSTPTSAKCSRSRRTSTRSSSHARRSHPCHRRQHAMNLEARLRAEAAHLLIHEARVLARTAKRRAS